MTIDTTNPKAPEVAFLPRRRAELTAPSRRHSRKCTVCHHPFRYLIELNFLRWTSPSIIARHFGINDRASIYHHAHATHLFEFRALISYGHRLGEQRDYEMATNPILIAAARGLEPPAPALTASPPPSEPTEVAFLPRRRASNRRTCGD